MPGGGPQQEENHAAYLAKDKPGAVAWRSVANAQDLEEGIPRIVPAGDDAVLLVRIRGIIHATAALCPHKFTSLDEATVDPAGTITCHQHAACFELATGAPRPGSEFAGRLPVYATQVVDGVVQVQMQ